MIVLLPDGRIYNIHDIVKANVVSRKESGVRGFCVKYDVILTDFSKRSIYGHMYQKWIYADIKMMEFITDMLRGEKEPIDLR